MIGGRVSIEFVRGHQVEIVFDRWGAQRFNQLRRGDRSEKEGEERCQQATARREGVCSHDSKALTEVEDGLFDFLGKERRSMKTTPNSTEKGSVEKGGSESARSLFPQ
jgi:hypothetical protein